MMDIVIGKRKAKTADKVGAGIIGAAAGAAVGAAAVILSDEKNRKAVAKKATELSAQAKSTMDDLKKQAQQKMNSHDAKEVKKQIDTASKKAEKAVKEPKKA